MSKHRIKNQKSPKSPKSNNYVIIIYPSVKINKDEFNDIVDLLDEVTKIKEKNKTKLKYADMVQLLLTLNVIDGINNTPEDVQKDMSINMSWNTGETKTIYWFVIEPKINIGIIRSNIDKYISNVALDRIISVNEDSVFNPSITKTKSSYPLNDDKIYDDNDNMAQMINTMAADRIYSRITTDTESAKMYLDELNKL